MTNVSYYVIYYEKFRKIMQQTDKEALIEEMDIKTNNAPPQKINAVDWL